jgi:ribosomal RNA-processing protein 12
MERNDETGDGGAVGKNHLQDILNTFTEIIQHETKNPSYHPSATEYYALIMTTLKSASNIDQNHLKSLLHLLTLLIPQTNQQILLSQFQVMVELFSHYLQEIPDKKTSLYCLALLGDLMGISEGSDAVWRTQSMLKLLNIFLKVMDDSNEKLQKIGHQKLGSLLEKHKQQNVKIARGYVAEFCSTILQSCHRSNYKRSLQVVTFLERSLPSFSPSDISILFRSCLALQECEQPLLTAQVFRTLDSFFQYPFVASDTSFQALLPEMFSILINNPPQTPDMESIAFYCTSLASAVAALYRVNPSGFWSQSPHPVVQVSALLLSRCESEFSQIHCAVGVALKRIISACLDSSSPSSLAVKELVSVVEMGSHTILLEHPIGQFIDVMKGVLHLRFQHAWMFILDPIRTLFSQLPGHTGKVLLPDLVRMVADIYHAISTGVMTVSTGVDLSVRDTLGAIFRSLTLEHFLVLVPFRHANQTLTSDLDTSRDWMINILHANLKLVPCKLQDFLSLVLPVAKDLNAIIRSSRSQSLQRPQLNDSQLSILRTRVIQLWSLFPSFCSSTFGAPLDVATAFPPLVPILDAVMKDPDYPELLHYVVTGLTALATSVKEKYSVPLAILPKDLEALQSKGAPIFIPSLLSILEGVDVSTDSAKFQPTVTCVSAWAAVAAPGLVTKVSKRLIQLLLSSTNAESTNESTASSWLAVILALIPYQTEQMIMLLYRTIKPLLSVHESVSMQKRAYKVLHGLLLSHSDCLFKLEPKHQILEQISDSLLTCHVSARHIRLFCVASLIEGIVAEERELPSGTDQLSQACASVFCETLICLKDANKKSRDGALSLLKVIYAALPPQLILPHLFAGIVGETAAMRSASILGLTLLVKATQAKVQHKFSNSEELNEEEDGQEEGSSPPQNQEELMNQYNALLASIAQLLPTVLLLLKEESIEETRAILSFTKMCVSVLPRDTLLELLPVIVESVLVDNLGSGADDGKLKAKFSAKIRSLIRKAWQRVGEDAIRPLLPAGDAALLDYIQRQGRRTISKRERRQKKSGGGKGEAGDESDDDSDSDDSEEEDQVRQEESNKRGKKPARAKAIRASDFVGEGLPSSLQDLMDDQNAGGKKSRGADAASGGGDDDEDEEYHVQFSKDGRVMLVPKESKTVVAHSAQTAADGMDLELGEKTANRFQNEKEDKKESSKKRTREPGEEYRSKKAGGDVWRKGMLEPHAYIPLDARMLTKKNEKNAISHLGIAVHNATKRRLKESHVSGAPAPYDPNLSGGLGSKKVATMLSRSQRRAQIKGHTQNSQRKKK